MKPDGLFLAAFAGAGSLPRLKSAMAAGDAATGGAAPHVHPQIDVRAAGDLLARAGFALPVADSRQVLVRFSTLGRLVADLRAMGATNLLSARSRTPIGRVGLAAAKADFTRHRDASGKTEEKFEIVYLTGWASMRPDPISASRRPISGRSAGGIGKADI